METRVYGFLVVLALQIVLSRQWTASEDKKTGKIRKSTGESNKQYQSGSYDARRWTSRDRELRKKPSGHLAPLNPDDMDNDAVVSIAVGPPPIRPKFDKSKVRNKMYLAAANNTLNSKTISNAANLVKDVLTELGREFMSHQVNEDFVFGQYVGNSMKNLTSAIKLKMQHEILDLIVKYQKINGDLPKDDVKPKEEEKFVKYAKLEKNIKNTTETEEPWPDFSNLAKIVG